MTNIILSEKKWNATLCKELSKINNENWLLIDKKKDFTIMNINSINPDFIFIPHWSHIIPFEIFSTYNCIVFHMTDLPFGRGGSPLQNLIVNEFKKTKISAIKVDKGIDTGPVYLKKEISLEGSAEDIFNRSNYIIKDMIIEIIKNNIKPTPQTGKATYFKRRKPEMSNLNNLSNLEKIYDYIRMLDAESYPKAFIENELIKFEFYNAKYENNEIIANVRIFKK